MYELWEALVGAFWILIPAYAANGFPPLARGKIPIDRGHCWGDGGRIFGQGKTVEGFIVGVAAGTFFGAVETFIQPSLNAYAGLWGIGLPNMSIFIGFVIAFGALLGDLVGSFIKRRAGFESGADAPILDQLNFVVGSFVLASFFTQITIWMSVIAAIVTPIIHRTACIIGYQLRMKRVPW
jgi:CDP-2,3-bis-(O-geranylgeranyl)-sn-glycerol synthase